MNSQIRRNAQILGAAALFLSLGLAVPAWAGALAERAPGVQLPTPERSTYVVFEIVIGSEEPILVAARSSQMATFRRHDHDLYLGFIPTAAVGGEQVELQVIDLVEDGVGGKAVRDPAGGVETIHARPGITSFLNRELLIDLRVLYVGSEPWHLFGRDRPLPRSSPASPEEPGEMRCCVTCGGSTACGCAVGGGCGACCSTCCRY